MGGCVSVQKRKQRRDGKCQSSKCMKGWGRTVTPVPGAPNTNLKKEETNGFMYSSSETAIHNLVHPSRVKSVTAQSHPEVATINVHVTQLQRSHTGTDSYVGSKEEAYFDSLACLESDCDEDFLSVHGDFAPSAGNTWSHPSSVQGTPRPSVASLKDRISKHDASDDSTPTLIPIEKRRKLKEFFMEKLQSEDDTLGAEHAITSEGQVNGFPGSKNDDRAGISNMISASSTELTNGKHEVSKGAGANSSVLTAEVVDGEEDNMQDHNAKQMNNCCLPHLVPNISCSEKRRSSSLTHNGRKQH
eukprot:Gb_15624 [translate_table: standard]